MESQLPPSSPPNTIPFEDSSQPFVSRLFATIKAVLTDPIRTFSGMQPGELTAPLIYGVLVSMCAIIGAVAWQMLFGSMMALSGEEGGVEVLALTSGMMVLFLLLSPVLAAIGLFINSGIYHLMLMLVGGNAKGFSMTFRAICYGQTPAILGIVPICGGMIGGLWSVVLIIMGAIYGHSIDGWRGVVAYFLPTVICCGLAFLALSSLGIIGALSNQ